MTLIGPNGAGKTTLVRVLLGLEGPDGGSIVRQPGLVVGYAPQRFEVDRAIPLTVDRFVKLGRRAGPGASRACCAEVGAGQLGERQLSELSGGELQRVVLARALIRSPSCWCWTSRCAASTSPARPSSTPSSAGCAPSTASACCWCRTICTW